MALVAALPARQAVALPGAVSAQSSAGQAVARSELEVGTLPRGCRRAAGETLRPVSFSGTRSDFR